MLKALKNVYKGITRAEWGAAEAASPAFRSARTAGAETRTAREGAESARVAARREASAEVASESAAGYDDVKDIYRDGMVDEARAVARGDADMAKAEIDHRVALKKLETERAISNQKKEWAKQDRNWFQRHKIMTGLGALGAGGLAYNIAGPAGTPVVNGGMSPEESGAQKAAMDAMANGYGPVMMGAPMPQVQAANLNYEGPVVEQSRQASL